VVLDVLDVIGEALANAAQTSVGATRQLVGFGAFFFVGSDGKTNKEIFGRVTRIG